MHLSQDIQHPVAVLPREAALHAPLPSPAAAGVIALRAVRELQWK
jgi:hypothetical protein